MNILSQTAGNLFDSSKEESKNQEAMLRPNIIFSQTINPRSGLAQNQQQRNRSCSKSKKSAKSGKSGKSTGQIDKLIQRNLRKQREKNEQELYEQQVENERQEARRKELQHQNNMVRQINKEKLEKSQKRHEAIDLKQQSSSLLGLSKVQQKQS